MPKEKKEAARLKINPMIGRPPTLEWVAPADLRVDSSYQRSLESETSVALIRRIAIFWDWGLCQPINAARRQDGSLWIVDGQHRHAAAILRGDIPHLPCVIIPFRDKGEEAAAFVALNRQRRALGPVDVFRAQLAAGDEAAVEVMAVLEAAGLRVANHQNYFAWKPGELYCIPTIATAHRRYGRAIVRPALTAFALAYRGQILQFAGQLLNAIFPVYAEECRQRGFDDALFSDVLGRKSQSEWLRLARAYQGRHESNLRDALRSVFTEAYLDAASLKLEAAS